MTIRQYNMLKSFYETGGVGIEDALRYHQTTFGSVCLQKWVVFSSSKRMFILSPEGKDAYAGAKDVNLFRMHEARFFSQRVHLPIRIMQQSNVTQSPRQRAELEFQTLSTPAQAGVASAA